MKIQHLKKTLIALGLIASCAAGAAYMSSDRSSEATSISHKINMVSPANADTGLAKMGTHPLGEQSVGPKDAPVVIVEYASFTCPHCASFHNKVYPQIKKELVETGKVRFIYRDFPLDNTSFAISAIARCIAKDKGQDKFFPLINMLFEKQSSWMQSKELKKDIIKITKLAGYGESKVDACLKREPISKGINEVREFADQKLGVRGTPTLFINGEIYQGRGNFEAIQKKVESLIKK